MALLYQAVLELNSPKNRLKNTRLLLDATSDKLSSLIKTRFNVAQGELASESARLVALNPLAILARGYGLVQNDNGKTICGVESMSKGDNITITMADGKAYATVTDKEVR